MYFLAKSNIFLKFLIILLLSEVKSIKDQHQPKISSLTLFTYLDVQDKYLKTMFSKNFTFFVFENKRK